MKNTLIKLIAGACLCALPSVCQDHVPVYRVTVIQRTVDSVNYQYKAGPTKIDFRGTVLLPTAKGDATVDPQKGRTQIDAKFEGLEPPQRFGPEYLSYVLWAVTPDGASHNLGEVVPNGANRAHLPVTTGVQAFGLIVTAEPYAAVRHPSDIVVLQNEVRPDTIGDIHPVQVKVELMPRGEYTWNVPAGQSGEIANAPKVSMPRYEAILQTYEAQNALGIARAAGADRLVPDVYGKAQAELQQAQQLQTTKGNDDRIVQHARAATEIAEDARIIAERRQQEEELRAARTETGEAQQRADRERARAETAEAQAQNERQAREQAEMDARVARQQSQQMAAVAAAAAQQPAPAPAPQVTVEVVQAPDRGNEAGKQMRSQLLRGLNTAIVTRDTPRGLDATVTDGDFAGSQLRPGPANAVSQMAAVLMSHPGLRVSVEGNSDSPETAEVARQRADAVTAALIRAGVPAQRITSQGLGNSRLLVSDATEQGRIENRRVEIVITGDEIGTVPVWDRTYPISFGRNR